MIVGLLAVTQTEARYITIAVVLFLLIVGMLVGVRLILHHKVRRVRFGVFLERNGHDDEEREG